MEKKKEPDCKLCRDTGWYKSCCRDYPCDCAVGKVEKAELDEKSKNTPRGRGVINPSDWTWRH